MTNHTSRSLPGLWLASKSPRRAQILQSMGLGFKVLLSNAKEATLIEGSVRATVLENARRKAVAVTPSVSSEKDIIIGADTLVALENSALTKPRNREEALSALRALSGKTHHVLTGLVLLSRQHGRRESCTETLVTFRPLTEDQMCQYADTPEPYDKAGGYGIQGAACLFIDRVEGSYSNVVGLPAETLLQELAHLTGIGPFQWLMK